MSRIPYYVEKVTTDEIRNVDRFALNLSEASTDGAYALKQIVPICDEDGTSVLYAIYELNNNLIHTNLWIDDDNCDDKYLTAEQIKLIQDLGFVEVNGIKREIEKVTVSWNDDSYEIYATIDLKEMIEE